MRIVLITTLILFQLICCQSKKNIAPKNEIISIQNKDNTLSKCDNFSFDTIKVNLNFTINHVEYSTALFFQRKIYSCLGEFKIKTKFYPVYEKSNKNELDSIEMYTTSKNLPVEFISMIYYNLKQDYLPYHFPDSLQSKNISKEYVRYISESKKSNSSFKSSYLTVLDIDEDGFSDLVISNASQGPTARNPYIAIWKGIKGNKFIRDTSFIKSDIAFYGYIKSKTLRYLITGSCVGGGNLALDYSLVKKSKLVPIKGFTHFYKYGNDAENIFQIYTLKRGVKSFTIYKSEQEFYNKLENLGMGDFWVGVKNIKE